MFGFCFALQVCWALQKQCASPVSKQQSSRACSIASLWKIKIRLMQQMDGSGLRWRGKVLLQKIQMPPWSTWDGQSTGSWFKLTTAGAQMQKVWERWLQHDDWHKAGMSLNLFANIVCALLLESKGTVTHWLNWLPARRQFLRQNRAWSGTYLQASSQSMTDICLLSFVHAVGSTLHLFTASETEGIGPCRVTFSRASWIQNLIVERWPTVRIISRNLGAEQKLKTRSNISSPQQRGTFAACIITQTSRLNIVIHPPQLIFYI